MQVTQNTGQLVKLVDTQSPLDNPATLKIANTRIANVYTTLAKGVIPVGAQALNTTGQTVFCELTMTASSTTGDTTVSLPIVSRIELRLPNHPDVTNAVVAKVLEATIAGLCGSNGSLRVTDVMRGILVPA
jgi:hypothetical protein